MVSINYALFQGYIPKQNAGVKRPNGHPPLTSNWGGGTEMTFPFVWERLPQTEHGHNKNLSFLVFPFSLAVSRLECVG